MRFLCVILLFLLHGTGHAQADDRHYFDFWEGRWVQEIDGLPDTTKTIFDVVRGIHPYSFEEDWTMVFDSSRMKAKGVRVWDGSWTYLWMSEKGHFQIWEGRKIDGNWYITRRFDIAGDRYLSRQAWIPESHDRLTRVSEKSYDDGKTWILRFREYYRRVEK